MSNKRPQLVLPGTGLIFDISCKGRARGLKSDYLSHEYIFKEYPIEKFEKQHVAAPMGHLGF